MSDGQWIERGTLDEWEDRMRDQAARIRELEAENKALREAFGPFAATLERHSGFTEYALFGVWEDVKGAAGRKLNILRKQNFDDARTLIEKDQTNE